MTDLATIDGKSLELFKSDPINDLLYSMGLEMQKNGLEIAQKAYDHYFVNNKESDDIVTQYGQVCNLKKNPCPILNDLIPFSLQFTSDIGFFKCVDDSVKLLTTSPSIITTIVIAASIRSQKYWTCQKIQILVNWISG